MLVIIEQLYKEIEKQKLLKIEEGEKLLVTKYSNKIGLSYDDSLYIIAKILSDNYNNLTFNYITNKKDLLKFFHILNKFSGDKEITSEQAEIFFRSILKDVLIEEKIIKNDADILKE